MTFWFFIQKLFAYGCLGVMIEFFFTGVASLLKKNWKATGHSYLWMIPIYGFAALALEGVSEALPWPFYLKALLYVPIIYGVEALSGWALSKLIGHIPWDYQKSKWTPMGLINLTYAPFWLILALAFDPISGWMRKTLNYLATME
jgi:uncharacterized membrane protein